MRFTDEKPMWYADTEMLAKQLSNKTEREVQEIFDKHDVIKLKSTKRPSASFMNRLVLVIVFIPLVILSFIKWVVTGDRYLDSWVKKNRALGFIVRLAGIE